MGDRPASAGRASRPSQLAPVRADRLGDQVALRPRERDVAYALVRSGAGMKANAMVRRDGSAGRRGVRGAAEIVPRAQQDSHAENRLDHTSFLGVVCGGIDVVKRVVGDDPLDREVALLP